MGCRVAEAHLCWSVILIIACLPCDCETDFPSGKVLADANTVESYKIEEKGFIVCMVSKVSITPGFRNNNTDFT